MANELNIRLVLDGSQLRAELRNDAGAVQTFGTQAKQQADQVNSAFEGIIGKARGIAASILAIAGISFGAGLVADAGRAADTMADLSGRIRQVSSSDAEYRAGMSETFRISQQYYGQLESTVALYSRAGRSLQEMGYGQAVVAELTETMAAGLLVGRASTQEAASATLQFSQALGTGVLRGEEFNAVNEAAPDLMRILAQSLGVTRGELRGLAEDGKLTADVLVEAFTGAAADALKTEAADVPLTMARAWLQLSNAALQYVGTADLIAGTSSLVAGALGAAAQNLDALAAGMAGIATTIGVAYVARLTAGILAKRAAAAQTLALAGAELREAQAAEAAALAALNQQRERTMLMATTVNATVAENAYAAAQARTAAAQAAATAAGAAKVGMLGRMGSAMLGLVGGPIGATILALGAIGTAIYVSIEAERQREAAWQKGMEASRAQVDALLERVQKLNEEMTQAGGLNVGGQANALSVAVEAEADLAAKREELRKKTEALRATEEAYARAKERAVYASEAGSLAAASAASRLAGEMAKQRAEVAAAQQAVNDLTPAINTLKINFEAASPAVAAGAEAVSRIRDAFSGGWLEGLRALAGNFAELGAASNALAADASLNARLETFNSLVADAQTKIDKHNQGLASWRKQEQELAIAEANRIDATGALAAQLRKNFDEGEKLIAQAANLRTAKRDQAAEAERAAKAAADYAEETAKMAQEAVIASIADESARALAEYSVQLAEVATLQDKGKISAQAAAERQQALAAQFANTTRELQKNIAAQKQAQAAPQALLAGYQRQIELLGMTEQARASAVAQGEAELAMLDAIAKAKEAGADISAETAAQWVEDAVALADMRTEAERLDDILRGLGQETGLDRLARDIATVQAAIERGSDAMGNAFSAERLAEMRRALGGLRQEALAYATGALGEGITALQSMASEGSKAYAILETAQAALNLATAIGAIANQGMGDPYTAFARIAAMAAIMSQLVDGLGSIRGGLGGSAEQRQQAQGTGTVLGDSAAESKSIARAAEITADATSELVGINRGMLNALQAMQAGVGSASGMLARGGNSMEFSALPNTDILGSNFGSAFAAATGHLFTATVDKLMGGLFSSVVNKLLGGKSEITDTGILIGGGLLTDLLEGISVGAYQEVKSRSWWFGSTRTSEEIQSLGDDVAVQFQLVLDSMADAVREGARALGLDLDKVNAAIAAFQVAEIRISTQGLSAEEAQAELESVFSSIFDGLAGTVVPFVGQFQQVGEGLGETLVRVATGVQVTQEAVKQLGFAFDEADPEKFAQASEGLIALVGGIEIFISGMSSFVNSFATEEHKFALAQEALNSAFGQAGLEVPATRDVMWDLMQSLDATTEAGREQIATLIRLSGVADDYYGMLEDRQAELVEKLAAYADFIDGFRPDELPTGAAASTVDEALRQSWAWSAAMVEQANDLARAAGLAGAAEEDLALIHIRAAEYVMQAADRIAAATTAYDDFIAGIARETKALSAYQAGMLAANDWYADSVARANELARAAGLAGARVQDLAVIELRHAQLAAQALRQLQQSAQDLIAQLYGPAEGSLDAINAQIAALESQTTSHLDAINSATNDAYENWRRNITSVQDYLDSMLLGDLSTLGYEDKLAEALRQFNAAVAAGDGQTATQLADAYLRLLSQGEATGGDFTAGAAMIRDALQGMLSMPAPAQATGGAVAITASAELQALYVERDRLLAEQEAANRLAMAQQLAGYLVELAAAQEQPILDLATSLGVRLDQFVSDLGVDLSHVTVATVQQLADLSGLLGVSLADLSAAVGVSIGALTDQYSLAAGALAAEILGLPAEQAALLQPYFDAIAAATTAADASAATQAMADYIGTLDAAIRDQLAPYFGSLMTETESAADAALAVAQAQQDTMVAQLQATAVSNALLDRIAANLGAANDAAGVPSYAVGTGYVPADGLAMIHRGEGIIPAPVNAWMHEHGYPTAAASDNRELIAEIRQLRGEVEKLTRAQREGTTQLTGALEKTSSETRVSFDQSLKSTLRENRRSTYA